MTRQRIHYAWVILALCFLGVLSAQGVRLAFGAFVQPWEQAFQMSRAQVSMISLASYIVYGVTQPLVGKLIDRLGVRSVLSGSVLLVGVSTFLTAFASAPSHLFWLYGLVTSIGFGGADFATVAPTQLLASKYFSGSSVGVVFGLLSLVHQIGSALGSYVPGLVYTATGSYDLVIAGALVALVAAALLPLMLPAAASRRVGQAVQA